MDNIQDVLLKINNAAIEMGTGEVLTIIGLIPIFMIFCYETLNKYADARKKILISFAKDIKNKPLQYDSIIKIQSLGKKYDENDEDVKKIMKHELNCDVTRFIREINSFRCRRIILVIWGLATMALWGCGGFWHVCKNYHWGSTIFTIIYILVTMIFLLKDKVREK